VGGIFETTSPALPFTIRLSALSQSFRANQLGSPTAKVAEVREDGPVLRFRNEKSLRKSGFGDTVGPIDQQVDFCRLTSCDFQIEFKLQWRTLPQTISFPCSRSQSSLIASCFCRPGTPDLCSPTDAKAQNRKRGQTGQRLPQPGPWPTRITPSSVNHDNAVDAALRIEAASDLMHWS